MKINYKKHKDCKWKIKKKNKEDECGLSPEEREGSKEKNDYQRQTTHQPPSHATQGKREWGDTSNDTVEHIWPPKDATCPA